ncbi:MFS transporter [Brevibacterium litoralis]|uniref:MFS transporter n=1 Tax=Brevibacterium litoralis TaxID=3138935 RepID=UPI0032ED1B4F
MSGSADGHDSGSQDPPFEGYLKGDPRTKRVEIGLFLAGIATFTLLYNTQAILPYFSHEYDITPSQAAMSVSAATAGLGLGLLAAVPVSERLGRVTLIRFSLLASTVLGIATAFTDDWSLFLVSRFVMGFLLAGLPGTAAVYIKEEIHRSYSTTATSIYIFGTTMGGLAGRIVAAGIIELVVLTGLDGVGGLGASNLAMLGTALLAAVCAGLCWALLPASRGFTPHRDSPAVLVRKFGRNLKDPVLVGLFLLGGLGMGTFVGTFNSLGYRLESPPYLLSVGAVSLLYFVYPIAGYSSVVAGRAADRFSLRAVMPFGGLLGVVGVLTMALPHLAFIVVGMAVMAVGFFVMHSLASAWVAARSSVATGATAQAASLYTLTYYVGSSISGNLTPLAWEGFGWPGVTTVGVGLMGTAFLISLLLRRSKPSAV